MEGEIVNRVAESALEVFDLEDYYPLGARHEIDLAQWLADGYVLREKEFRQALKEHDWTQYEGAIVGVFCSTEAILPGWAALLVSMHAAPFARRVFSGRASELDQLFYAELLPSLDYEPYRDKPVIIKGCSRHPVPENGYLLAAQFLQPVARSLMYGEACSAVPLYKRR